MSTPVLDALVGGILPHVHFKKIIVEPPHIPKIYNPNTKGYLIPTRTITLQMELYQRKDELLTKTWLKDLDLVVDDGPDKITSLFDFFKLNIVTVQALPYMNLIRKSNPMPSCQQPDSNGCKTWNNDSSIFVHKGISDNRDPWHHSDCLDKGKGDPFSYLKQEPISLSAVIDGKLSDGAYEQGQLREEVYNGVVYYAIPFQHTIHWSGDLYSSDDNKLTLSNSSKVEKQKGAEPMTYTQVRAANLGVIAYTSLDLAPVFYPNFPDGNVPYADQLNMEGPISAERVLFGGLVPKTREVFVNNMGKPWSGPVHYHSYANPGAKGYIGYMTGEFHTPDQMQEKLNVVEMANTLVQDFTDPLQQKVPSETIQEIDGQVVVYPTEATSNIGVNYKKIENDLGVILSPLQKEKKKYFLPDNDTEYSKLYITQDLNGAAHGVFYVDMYSLLKNNSQLFPYLRNTDTYSWANTVDQIMSMSAILDMSIHRTRINNTYAVNGYEEFEDDKVNEPPVRKVVCGQDFDLNHPLQETYYNDATLQEIFLTGLPNKHTRYFAFADHDVARRAVGSYRYSAEIKFHDGTQKFLKKKLQTYMELTQEMEAYYRLSISSRKVKVKGLEHMLPYGKKETLLKKVMKPYYSDRYKKFHYSFAIESEKHFNKGNVHLALRAAAAIIEYGEMFNFEKPYAQKDSSANYGNILHLMMPGPEISGSPSGILICLNILKNMCSEMQKILGGQKKKKQNNSNELGYISSPSDFQQVVMGSDEAGASSIRALIEEKHSWDHPNEIFKAIPNKNVYIDYLSLTPKKETMWDPGSKQYINGEIYFDTTKPPMKRISSAFYKKRCKSDLAKYTNYAVFGGFEGSDKLLNGTAEENWYGVQDGGQISLIKAGTQPGGELNRVMRGNNQPDTLSRMMYSYLTPSVVEISDPTKTNVQFKFLYAAFNESVFEIMRYGMVNEEPGYVYSNTFFDGDHQSSTYISMANYIKNRNNFGHADLSDSFPSGEAAIFGEEYGSDHALDMVRREAYKSYFSKHNITVHNQIQYSDFFGSAGDKEPGAINQKNSPYDPVPGEKVPWPYSPKDFSDGIMLSDYVLKGYAAAENLEKLLDLPKGRVSLGNLDLNNPDAFYDLPNVYKIRVVAGNFDGNLVNPDFLRQEMQGMIMSDNQESVNRNASIFFNFNMVAKIEKFSGYSTGLSQQDPFKSLAVDDNWVLLREEDLATGTHFCRISFYDKKLVGNIDSIPIVDKYFILKHGVDDYLMPQVTVFPDPADLPVIPEAENVAIWHAMNHEKLQDLMRVLEKGLLQEGNIPVLNLPPIGGGDPSPIDMPLQTQVVDSTGQQVSQQATNIQYGAPTSTGANTGIPGGAGGGGMGGMGGGGSGGGGGGY